MVLPRVFHMGDTEITDVRMIFLYTIRFVRPFVVSISLTAHNLRLESSIRAELSRAAEVAQLSAT